MYLRMRYLLSIYPQTEVKTGEKTEERMREEGDRQEKSGGARGQRRGLRGGPGEERKNRK